MKRLIILTLVIICVPPVFITAGEEIDFGDLKRYEKADPDEDIKKAIAKGDLRFIAIIGRGVEVPGVSNFTEEYSRYGYKVIEGTSDVIQSYEHGRLIQIARYYAENYNWALELHLDEVKSTELSRSLPGYEHVNKLFEISGESVGLTLYDVSEIISEKVDLVNKSPASFHDLLPMIKEKVGSMSKPLASFQAILSSKEHGCVKLARWYNPLKDDKPIYDWNQFLDVFKQTNLAVCQQSWIDEWIKSGENRKVAAQIFGIRPYTERSFYPFIAAIWKDSDLTGKPWYEINLREGDNWKGTAFLSSDSSAAIITSFNLDAKMNDVFNAKMNDVKKPTGSHWLDKLVIHYYPTKPEYIIVDKSGNWKVVKK